MLNFFSASCTDMVVLSQATGQW